ncbi:uncharacterized protein LOC112213547 [Bombus impatiens]|uniref:Uncharacterized protein LOC112213547 n=1 Tax=Bombus impatiens TaxID=132113 RepID=A0A6P8M0J6_BOMIM|nr:uncharacterized protein LOC112213547 [Bombus impatiens]
MQSSNESKEKRKSKGGIITGINKELREIEYKEISDHIVERKIVYNDKTYRVMVVYNQGTKGTWKEIAERVDEREEEVIIIGGGWNARTGKEGGPINEDLGKEKNRRSKDKTTNMEGRTLLKYLEEEWTYIGERGNSVIDYMIRNQEATEEIIDMKVGKRTESDHMPLEIEMGGGQNYEKMKKRKKKRRRKGNGQRKCRKISGGM